MGGVEVLAVASALVVRSVLMSSSRLLVTLMRHFTVRSLNLLCSSGLLASYSSSSSKASNHSLPCHCQVRQMHGSGRE